MERQKFEDSWKDSFKDAGVEPSESLWTNIELDLEKAEGKAMKKRVVFFQLLAAASVIFALAFAGFVYVRNTGVQSNQLAVNEPASTTSSLAPEASASAKKSTTDKSPASQATVIERTEAGTRPLEEPSSSDTHPGQPAASEPGSDNLAGQPVNANQVAPAATNSFRKGDNTPRSKSSHQQLAGNRQAATTTSDISRVDPNARVVSSAVPALKTDNRNSATSVENINLLATSGSLPALVTVRKPVLTLAAPAEPVADPVALMLARLNEEETKYSREEKKESTRGSENIWTSVGFAAGSFNTMTSGDQLPTVNPAGLTNSSLAVSNNVVQNQSSASGVAYSVGLSMGGKVHGRWVIQGGVNYLQQSSDYTTNAVVGSSDYQSFKAASINEVNHAGKTDARLVNTAAYSVNSNVQYLSVPLQAGYLIVNRNLGWQLNAGLSTDLFLQNTLTPEGGTLEKSSQGPGADSPYRDVNFSGLVGTELSYRFGPHYRVALNPGVRYPFSSIYKSDISVNAMPLTFDVGLKFRYIFN